MRVPGSGKPNRDMQHVTVWLPRADVDELDAIATSSACTRADVMRRLIGERLESRRQDMARHPSSRRGLPRPRGGV